MCLVRSQPYLTAEAHRTFLSVKATFRRVEMYGIGSSVSIACVASVAQSRAPNKEVRPNACVRSFMYVLARAMLCEDIFESASRETDQVQIRNPTFWSRGRVDTSSHTGVYCWVAFLLRYVDQGATFRIEPCPPITAASAASALVYLAYQLRFLRIPARKLAFLVALFRPLFYGPSQRAIRTTIPPAETI